MAEPEAVEPALIIKTVGVGTEGNVMSGNVGGNCIEHPTDIASSADIDAAVKEVKWSASFHAGIQET